MIAIKVLERLLLARHTDEKNQPNTLLDQKIRR